MEKYEIVRAWCEQRIGCPYIYGATGKACTPSYRQARAAQYPAYADKIRRNCPRLKGAAEACSGCRWCDPETGTGKLAYDCAQLSRWAMDAVGISLVSGANSQWQKTKWARRGDLADLPNGLFGKVFLVFRWDEDKQAMGHVGVYQGDGTVIHAKGHDYGVVRQPLNEVKFTHYGLPYGLYEEVVPMDHPTLRKGDSGPNVIYLQTLLCDVGETLKADGIFGDKTEAAVRDFQRLYSLTVDGIVGPATWSALEVATGHQGSSDKADQPDEEPAEDPDQDDVIMKKADFNALKAALVIAYQTIKKYDSVG